MTLDCRQRRNGMLTAPMIALDERLGPRAYPEP